MDISYAEKVMEFVMEQNYKGNKLTDEQIKELMEQAKRGVKKEDLTYTKQKKESWLKRIFK